MVEIDMCHWLLF